MNSVKLDYSRLLGDWSKILGHSLLDTAYMDRLIEFLERAYGGQLIYPKQPDIFRAFRVTQYKDVRVVIIGQDPYPDGRATGLAFANDDQRAIIQDNLSPSLQKIRACIETTIYKGLNLDFDPTLMSWADQGVLLLNSALTVQKNMVGSHTKIWHEFMSKFLQSLSHFKPGLSYLLLGSQSSVLEQHIDHKRNYIFKYVHPAWAARQNTEWNCPYFRTINEMIAKQNGEEYKIKW